MDRKQFIKTCGGSCLALLGISLLQQCVGTHYVQSNVADNKISVAKQEFIHVKKDKQEFRKYIIVKSGGIEQPLVIYRLGEGKYSALLMRCTHQGLELNVNGDILTCAAHGSEFSKFGEVVQGPADQNLKKFNVIEDEKNIYVQLV
jgi:Rieske Fe-S protein